ncbi:hypothetical protein ACLI08_16185 [Flavobacterium sp. RNTU_13]|uniref:hypothetical protein n=1 Tax=Flavobacterium sp. RNTU_13 TaxID=3375145 RepID=UPI003985BD49
MIFENYPYKVKLQALGIIFLILMAAAYKRSFSQLFDVMGEYKTLKSQKEEFKKNNGNVADLSAKLQKIDRIIGKETVDKEKIQQEIVSFTASSRFKVSIFDMKSVHTFKDEDYTIYSNQLDVTGNFNELLSLAYAFEKEFTLSKIANMNFYTVKKNNTPTVLHLKMIFQNYENNK